MWPLFLPLIVQVFLIAHVIKTGRNSLWILALLIPYAGALAYVAFELLPELLGGRGGRRAARGLGKVLNPRGDLRKYETEAKITGNVASQQRYADELINQGRFDDAIAAYRNVLKGLYEHDPNLMLGLARAQFAKGDAAGTRATLDELIRLNPDFKSSEGHLLYARALETSGDVEKALQEYHVLAPSYPGAEAGARYAQLLQAQGRAEDARKVAEELLEEARIAPGHYRRAQKTWLDIAERLLGR